MEKIRESGFLKILCYILIPVLVAIFGLSIFHIAFLNEFGNSKEEITYSQTENFANNYLYFFISKIADCQNVEMGYNFIEMEDSKGNFYYYSNNQSSYNYYNGIGAYINYVIIDRKSEKMFTNIKSNNYQEVMDNMKNQKIYWNIVNGKVNTNLNHINQENIQYNYAYRNSSYGTSDSQERKEFGDYDIYSSYDEEKTTQTTNFVLNKNVYDFMLQHKKLPMYSCAMSLIILVIIASYLFWAIGHKKGKEGIYLNPLDRMPYEIVSIVCFNLLMIVLNIAVNSFTIEIYYVIVILYMIAYLVGYIACSIWGVTTIKRIKAGTFWKSFLSYKIIRWFYRKIKKFVDEIKHKTSSGKKVFWYYGGFVLISVVLGSLYESGIAIFILFGFWIWVFYRLRKWASQQDKIRETLEQIYQGKTDIYLDDEELEGVLKEMAIYINDIAGGFSNAIEESLKSERLKTELITNVSHDIKTPLTSIINYVDLLKKEEIQDEKVKEYIQILDNKSQRLKKLTEDLVEASKVSSGNVKLNIEEINLKELINQSIGEFKDRFEEKKLKIEIDMPDEEIRIRADNRYMYRVIENLFSNITKYALDNSRVYIDMKKARSEIEISIKNISREKLNISSDELMQRFVRGDKSRYTEGSGLGLSIAKSLTELQGGKFDVIIDGDLFKVVMKW